MDIQIGDDITIAGEVIKAENGCFKVETKNHNQFWILPDDIKTHRPIDRREEDDLK